VNSANCGAEDLALCAERQTAKKFSISKGLGDRKNVPAADSMRGFYFFKERDKVQLPPK
jgi:hypothetical protein